MKDPAKDSALSDWRRENWKAIMEKNRLVLESIRDDPGAKDRDKVEAAKALSRMADCISPEKLTLSKNLVGTEIDKRPPVALTEAEERKLEAILHDVDTPSPGTLR